LPLSTFGEERARLLRGGGTREAAGKPARKGLGVKSDPGIVPALEADTCAEKLAQFFPQAARVRLAVQVTALRPGAGALKENTVVEFAAADHAIFSCSLPLEFDDRVQLALMKQGERRVRRSKTAEGTVIAVQYHEGRKAVAVRLLDPSIRWMSEP
jgi:hypothetical protein